MSNSKVKRALIEKDIENKGKEKANPKGKIQSALARENH